MNVMLTIYLPQRLKAQLTAYASTRQQGRALGASLNGVVLEILQEYLSRHEGQCWRPGGYEAPNGD